MNGVARSLGLALTGVATGLVACATPAHVQKVEMQVGLLRAEIARQDSARAQQLDELIATQRRVFDSLEAVKGTVRQLRGDLGGDLYSVQQQLVQVQALTGQSQQRLTELRTQLEARAEQLAAAPRAPVKADSGAAVPGAPAPSAGPSAEQMYEASLQQLRRGSTTTARAGLRELLRAHPQDDRVPDALYFIGQSFQAENADSAAEMYQRVAKEYPASPRAPAALYNLGLLAERRKDLAGAREAFQRLIKTYPKTDEAALARERVKAPAR